MVIYMMICDRDPREKMEKLKASFSFLIEISNMVKLLVTVFIIKLFLQI